MFFYISFSLAKIRIPIEERKLQTYRKLHQRGIDLLDLLIIGINATFQAIGQKRGSALMETMIIRLSVEVMPLIVINVANVSMVYGVIEVFLMAISVKHIKNGFLEWIIVKDVKMRDLYLSLFSYRNYALMYISKKFRYLEKRLFFVVLNNYVYLC